MTAPDPTPADERVRIIRIIRDELVCMDIDPDAAAEGFTEWHVAQSILGMLEAAGYRLAAPGQRIIDPDADLAGELHNIADYERAYCWEMHAAPDVPLVGYTTDGTCCEHGKSYAAAEAAAALVEEEDPT